jgi:polygalacturonase
MARNARRLTTEPLMQHAAPSLPNQPTNSARRRLMRAAGLLFSAPLGVPALAAAGTDDPWRRADAIAAQFAEPLRFPQRDFPIADYGAQACALVSTLAWTGMIGQARVPSPAPGAFDCRPAIRAAMLACHAAGGGRVLIPAGAWLCAGPIELLSGVNLHLQAGAHVYFGNDPAAYAKDPSEGCVQGPADSCTGYFAMIHARGQRHIALTGEDWSAILDGQGGLPFGDSGDAWWSWHPEPGRGNFARRPALIELVECEDVLLQGYQLRNAPGWVQHPVDCRRVALRKVYVNSQGPNNDGFDPESCDTVLIEQCRFDTRDDCIAIKSGKGIGRTHQPTRNVLIQDCTMQKGVGGITLGSETAGGIEHVYVRNIRFLDAFLNAPILFKTNMNRGRWIRHVYIRGIDIPHGIAGAARYYASQRSGFPMPAPTMPYWKIGVITFDCAYAATRAQPTRVPELSDIRIEGVRVGNLGPKGAAPSCWQALVVQGPVAAKFHAGQEPAPTMALTRVTIADCDFGTPANAAQPCQVFEPAGLRISEFNFNNVRIGGAVLNGRPPF